MKISITQLRRLVREALDEATPQPVTGPKRDEPDAKEKQPQAPSQQTKTTTSTIPTKPASVTPNTETGDNNSATTPGTKSGTK